MTTDHFKPNMPVIYIPTEANHNRNHPNCEHGFVSSVNARYVFVKSCVDVMERGWDNAPSRACDPNQLFKRQ